MAEDPQTGPVPPQGRPEIGARLAMAFLATIRMILIFPAIAMVLGAGLMILSVCFFEEKALVSLIRILGTLAFAEVMIGTMVGARYLRDGIASRYASPASKAVNPVASCGDEVVLMIEVLLTACGLALLVWIPAEISRMRNMGFMWPCCWAILGGSAMWARHMVLKWIRHRSVSPDTDPCSTPGTPPSGAP